MTDEEYILDLFAQIIDYPEGLNVCPGAGVLLEYAFFDAVITTHEQGSEIRFISVKRNVRDENSIAVPENLPEGLLAKLKPIFMGDELEQEPGNFPRI